MQEVVKDKGYATGATFKFMEKHYMERVYSDPRKGKETWIWWRTSKTEEGSTYYVLHIDLDYHFRFVQDIEVMQQGKKVKTQKGEVEIILDGWLELDPGDEWENHWFLKHVHELFYTRIWSKRREAIINSLRGDVYKMQALLKQMFEMKEFTPTKPGFYPPTRVSK